MLKKEQSLIWQIFKFSVLNKILPDEEKEQAIGYKNIQLKFSLARDPLFYVEESRKHKIEQMDMARKNPDQPFRFNNIDP